ncbi:DEAD/DEAH box helicase [Thermaerobacter sp. PB12/4term]|uniref:DEAD/DEAH box helicase n=1 Tax=Thermaerobacter sp. PB12/4term TaxID=2293838 RepID=UPI001314B1ED|nr:DEAD/DEAH box helicase [Thermaerobacter sp. PB12/4term]QIA27744.1 DEAD/DEAH box helicase [Thermaerobacter sp. PB12/4term]
MEQGDSAPLLHLLQQHGFRVVYRTRRPGRTQEVFPFDRLGLTEATCRFLSARAPQGLYLHQVEGITRSRRGADVGVTTRTASGKTLVFQAVALEHRARDPRARILAVYPLKALAREQEARWRQAFQAAGLDPATVARIDGDTHAAERLQQLRRATVLLATPDILHAWLVPNVGDNTVWSFLTALRLVVVDEVHVYTGVFGSNAAMLFRRLEHLCALGERRYHYLAASATVRDPRQHFRALFGRPFDVIDDAFDTSGQQEVDLVLVETSPTEDLMSRLSAFLAGIVRSTDHRFIAFVDSRKQTELLATIIKRERAGARGGDAGGEASGDGILDDGGDGTGSLGAVEPSPDRRKGRRSQEWTALDVLPYRAGLEEVDRALIEQRLATGNLRGIISTSALELGIDVPHLDVGVLVGVPHSATSLQQRMGRIGRHGPGTVIIVNNRDFNSEMVFRHPETILNLPPAESALYLENPRIQYIHAMCLARPGGEHDQAAVRAGCTEDGAGFSSPVDWPEGFLELCRRERVGETPPNLQPMKVEAGDAPHTVFPLRDVDAQFHIELHVGWEREDLGSISHGQLMREAYPGAIYYYLTQPYRVTQVHRTRRVVKVRREHRHYTTRPLGPVSIVRPYLQPGEVYRAKRWGELVLLETQVQIQEKVEGYRERRGSTEVTERYPLPLEKGYFRQPAFTRYYYTTGVVLFHPGLQDDVELTRLAQRIYDAFLLILPFERQDIHYAAGQLGGTPPRPLYSGARFIAIYDQTYGSLRLSGRLAEPEVVHQVLAKAAESVDVSGGLSRASAAWLEEARRLVETHVPVDVLELLAPEAAPTQDPSDDHVVEVILPGSVGLDAMRNHEEFFVEAVVFNAVAGTLCYRGRHTSTPAGDPTLITLVPVTNLVPIPGESRLGLYNLMDGTITPRSSS